MFLFKDLKPIDFDRNAADGPRHRSEIIGYVLARVAPSVTLFLPQDSRPNAPSRLQTPERLQS